MNRLTVSLFFLGLSLFHMQAQSPLSETGLPVSEPNASWNSVTKARLMWGSVYQRYDYNQVPESDAPSRLLLHAWRGERVAAQAVLLLPVDADSIRMEMSDLTCGRNRIPARNVNRYFVCYTKGDGNYSRQDSVIVADRLSPVPVLQGKAHTVRPMWLDIHVPEEAVPGIYRGSFTVWCDGHPLALPLSVEVAKRVLPSPDKWAFHLDLWQNPYAVARFYNVPLWSEEHFRLMRPLMQQYAAAGGKVITCSIIQHPWNGQTYDPFESMIAKFKQIDGSWRYDYSVFDRWVEFMTSCGVTHQIDCYTLVPWHYRFDYFDMASNSVRYVQCKPGEAEYESFLLPFLKDFASHLKAKGWFDRTCIAMDERPMEQLNAAYDIVHRADPNFRIEGAFNYLPEISVSVHDVSISHDYPCLAPSLLRQRRQDGQRITFYTCCGPERPNTFTFSPTAEAAYMGWHAAAIGYDGYLRWAYNSWPENPCLDARFGTWASGDTYLVYPDGSSIRMERLVEGIQAFEKVRILQQELTGRRLERLNRLLEPFRVVRFDAETDADTMVRQAQAELRKLE